MTLPLLSIKIYTFLFNPTIISLLEMDFGFNDSGIKSICK